MSYKITRDYNFIWRLVKNGERIIYKLPGELNNNHLGCTGTSILDKFSSSLSKEKFIEECKYYNIEFILPDSWVKINSENDHPAYLDSKGILVSNGEEVHEGYYDKDDKVFCGEEAIPFPKGWVKYWRIMPLAPGN